MTQTCILIPGMHRSGTSALAGTLGLLGVYLGSDLMQATSSNPKGHFENNRLFRINEVLLKDIGSRWDDVLFNEKKLNDRVELNQLSEIIEQEFRYSNIFLIKDPRLVYLFPLYIKVLKKLDIEVKTIIPVRNPLEVANSLRQRNGFGIEKGILLWVYHLLLSEKHSRGLPRLFTKFDDLIRDPEDFIKKLSVDLALDIEDKFKENKSKIEAFLEPDLKHHNISLDNLSGSVPAIVNECLKLVEQVNIRDVSKDFDALYKQVFDYQSLFYHKDIRESLIELNRASNKLELKEQETAKLKQQMDSKDESLRVKGEELASAISELHSKENETAILKQELDSRANTLRIADEQLLAARSELKTKEEETASLNEHVNTQKEALRIKDEALFAARTALQTREQQTAILNEQVNAKAEALRIIEEELVSARYRLQAMEQEAATLNDQISEKVETLAVKDEELSVARSELQAMKKQRVTLNDQVSGKVEALRIKDKELVVAQSRLQANERETTKLKNQLVAKVEELRIKGQELGSAISALQHRTHENETLNNRLIANIEKLRDKDKELKQLCQDLTQIYVSKSWRYTRPIRKVFRLFRKSNFLCLISKNI